MNVTGGNINPLSEKTFGYVQTKAGMCVCAENLIKGWSVELKSQNEALLS